MQTGMQRILSCGWRVPESVEIGTDFSGWLSFPAIVRIMSPHDWEMHRWQNPRRATKRT